MKELSSSASATSPQPAELARSALRRLAELKLPPTPEMYATHYYATAGAPAAPAQISPGPVDISLVERIEDILSKASKVTHGLERSTSSHSEEMSASLEALERTS